MVDAEYRFRIVHIGEYGRSSDGGVFAGSAIGKALDAKKLEVPDDQQLPGAEHLGKMPFTIVGDAAFPLKTYLVGLTLVETYPHNNASSTTDCLEPAMWWKMPLAFCHLAGG